ncbi:efflux RND transporter periplasmic adaptor subunit [Pseudomonas oryzihabitans]|uniref:efflux RND transporter periplasmic adaptor subunit n=1 Tax=Pseudomonas oryzihabitans TaxID=47885 RepID=UPI002893D756|nr:efflux RND transporter periplasmic adaptor subunit [Pseudomonas oryzihabitans]MDT3720685.1 efflux RND transporter periplasmic adaptor subunit [Pseudomonas oryzihabitans]
MNIHQRLKPTIPIAALSALPLITLLLLSGCKPETNATPVQQTVIVDKPQQRSVKDMDTYTGRFEATDTVEIRSRVSGYLDRVAFKEGSLVEKGELLFQIDPRPFQATVAEAEGALARARSQLDLNQQEFERASLLIKTETISKSLFDQRRQAVQSARAEVASAEAALARARLDLSFTRITAPMSGRIGRNLVSAGNLINGGDSTATVLTSIVSQNPIDIFFDIDESSYLRYANQRGRPDAGASELAVEISLPGDELPSLGGTLNFIDNRLDRSTGTLRLRARVPNPDMRLSPGQFGRVHLSGKVERSTLLVPDSAVATDATRRVLYVVDGKGLVAVRPVVTGRLFGHLREITEGLGEADTVIVEGFQRVRAGDAVKAQPAATPVAAASTASAQSGSQGGRP